ncbi:fungal pheromone STE3G-protein-coupled receptor [Pluteus cervinus]|uniref:Fungal pheromone STE3G-protein-coupled receptor n=1 Tax=Pluteus cervinus TaxID=181527 RepID=A0ACD3AJC7_9AGAR|nr:fungal pheromone STE3G-protein-coupled receptor [Pluteus cervinus]
MHPEFAPIAFTAAASLLLPLPWHWRAGNIATLSIIFWLFVCNVIYGVDAIIWSEGVRIIALVWCDITTKLIIGANFALPAACLCVCIHLERVASVRAARTSVADKRRRQIFELVMCFGLPCLFMALHYVVQGHRFDIVEGFGCRPTTYYSIPSIFIVWIPPLLMSLAALIYAGLALRHFIIRRLSFSLHLDASRSALTTSRYVRLVLMSVLQMFWSISLTSYAMWFTIMATPIRPWTNWADVHSNFSRVDTYPARFTPPRVATCFYVLWWTIPASTILFVGFFAFGRDAVDEYKQCFVWFRRNILRQSVSDEKPNKFGTLPTIRLVDISPVQFSDSDKISSILAI